MSYFVTSLDDPKKRLDVIWVGGSAMGDVVLSTRFMTGAYLLSGFGSGNMNYDCPVFEASMKVVKLFNQDKQDILSTKPLAKGSVDFSFEPADIITFSTPDDVPELNHSRLDFIRSKSGFFGINTRDSNDPDVEIIDPATVAWVSGPQENEYATMFGKKPYARRYKIFGALYDLAMITPPVMMNPIYPMQEGAELTYRGNRHVVKTSEPS